MGWGGPVIREVRGWVGVGAKGLCQAYNMQGGGGVVEGRGGAQYQWHIGGGGEDIFS